MDDTNTLTRLNEHAAEETAKIKFRDGKSITVKELFIKPDSASWTHLEGKGREATSTSTIQSVKIIIHKRDIVLVGSLAGATAGALVSYNNSEGSWYRGQVVGGMAGIGAAAGWFITSAVVGPRREVYKFKTTNAPPDRVD